MKWIKNTAIGIGSAVILLYFILGLIEGRSKVITVLLLLPLFAWPYLAYRYEKYAIRMAIAVGIIAIIWFAVDFIFLRIERFYWHIPVFILIAPLPAFTLAWMLWSYRKKQNEM